MNSERKDGDKDESINRDLSPVKQVSTPKDFAKKGARKVLFLKEKTKQSPNNFKEQAERHIADLQAQNRRFRAENEKYL